MDIKQYIDYFDELAHLERSEQFNLLDQACNKLPYLKFISIVIRLLSITIICGGVYLLFGYSLWLLLGSLLASLIVAKVIATEISDKLIVKQLNQLLATQDSN